MMILAMILVTATVSTAMPYHQAKREALFLADKMAYELNLTEDQYEAVYEINLDYLMTVSHRSRSYRRPWIRRDNMLRYVLSPWQYRAYRRADYFYKPIRWTGNNWRWGVYRRYDRSRFYRGRPSAFIYYRGGRPSRYYQDRVWYQRSKTNNRWDDDVYMDKKSKHHGNSRHDWHEHKHDRR